MNAYLRRGALTAAISVIGLTSVGCQSGPTGPTRVRDNEQRLVSLGLDIADLEETVKVMSTELINSGRFGGDNPSIVLVDNKAFLNNTTENIPSSRIMNGIREVLVNSGTVEVIERAGEAGDQAAIDRFLNDEVETFNYAIQLSMDEDRTVQGNTRERIYLLHFKLVRDGRTVWEKRDQVVKQDKKRGLGW